MQFNNCSNIIVVAGVPGTGKSLLGSRLARKLKYHFTTISWLVLRKGLWISYDPQTRSFVIDETSLKHALSALRCYVVETHWLEVFRGIDNVGFIVLTRTHPLKLLERLKARGWPWRKIAENVEAEFIGVIAAEAYEFIKLGVPVYEVDTSFSDVDKLAEEVIAALESGRTRCCIDWLSSLSEEELRILTSMLQDAQDGS